MITKVTPKGTPAFWRGGRICASLGCQCIGRSWLIASRVRGHLHWLPNVHHRRTIRASGRHHGAPARPGGCPWDREQTFDSIKPYTLEETYEVLEAIDNRDWPELAGRTGRPAAAGFVLCGDGEGAGVVFHRRRARSAFHQADRPASSRVWRRRRPILPTRSSATGRRSRLKRGRSGKQVRKEMPDETSTRFSLEFRRPCQPCSKPQS